MEEPEYVDLAPKCVLGSLGSLVPQPFLAQSLDPSSLCINVWVWSRSSYATEETRLQWVRGFLRGKARRWLGWMGGWQLGGTGKQSLRAISL